MPDRDRTSTESRNHLIQRLPPDDRRQLTARMERHTFRRHDVLIQSLQPLTHVYFPLTLVASVLTPFSDGSMVEVATIGNEGMVGWPVLLDDTQMRNQTICHIAGESLVMRAEDCLEEVHRNGAFRSLMSRYLNVLMNQMSQFVGCNARHSIQQRCARWLLMCHDRVGWDEFELTQEFLAVMLGVRRAGVSIAAGELQRLGLIRYQRGWITILDREGLEDASCECYQTVHDETERIMGWPAPWTTLAPRPTRVK